MAMATSNRPELMQEVKLYNNPKEREKYDNQVCFNFEYPKIANPKTYIIPHSCSQSCSQS